MRWIAFLAIPLVAVSCMKNEPGSPGASLSNSDVPDVQPVIALRGFTFNYQFKTNVFYQYGPWNAFILSGKDSVTGQSFYLDVDGPNAPSTIGSGYSIHEIKVYNGGTAVFDFYETGVATFDHFSVTSEYANGSFWTVEAGGTDTIRGYFQNVPAWGPGF
jgi:hypothetical protein